MTEQAPDPTAGDLSPSESQQLHQAGQAIGEGVSKAFDEFPADTSAHAAVPAVAADPPDNGSEMPYEAVEAEEPAGQ